MKVLNLIITFHAINLNYWSVTYLNVVNDTLFVTKQKNETVEVGVFVLQGV